MAKGIALFLGIVTGFITLSSCSKSQNAGNAAAPTPDVETFPIENSQFKNCHFKDVAPTYSANSTIPPNPIECDEGVATKVVLLSSTPLPTGVQFSMDSLSLTGSTAEKVTNVPYQFYIENPAGYLILNLKLTVK